MTDNVQSVAFSLRKLWDAFALTEAERRVASYPASHQNSLRLFVRAAGERARAADDLVESQMACAFVLYREAAVLYMAACVTTLPVEPLAQPLRVDEVAARFKQARAGKGTDQQQARVDRFLKRLSGSDILDVDRLRREEAAELARDTQALVRDLAGLVDPRTVGEVRFERRARLVGLGLVVVLVAIWAVSVKVARLNLALQRPVTTSGSYPKAASAPEGLTDGVKSGAYGVHTSATADPWVQVDLQAGYQIDKVKVYNRGDGWFDDALPMTLQLSENGTTFTDIETRSTSFRQRAPWIAKPGGKRARYVRIKGPTGKYVALSELEVFGRK